MNIPLPFIVLYLATALLAAYLYRLLRASRSSASNEAKSESVVAFPPTLHRAVQVAEADEESEEPQYVPSYERTDPSKPRYKPRSILTDNEAEFFGRLETAVPEYRIFPQVSMTAIIEPASKDRYWTHFSRIAMQRVDYAVYTRDLNLICVIELDDRTHDRQQKRDERRDSRLTEAGVQTLRFDSRAKPRPEVLGAAIHALAAGDTK